MLLGVHVDPVHFDDAISDSQAGKEGGRAVVHFAHIMTHFLLVGHQVKTVAVRRIHFDDVTQARNRSRADFLSDNNRD